MTILHMLILILLSFSASIFANSNKPVISDSALFTINNSFPLMARIDTGASRTSINATNIKISNGHKNMKLNVGKKVSFNIIDENGYIFPTSTKVLAVRTVITPQGKEHRYLVQISLTWNGKESKVKVNLRDRSNLKYKLLIGRDWLNQNALVDVAPKTIIGGVADYFVANDFPITARVDTGAESTSINATNIEVHKSSKKMTNNVGKMISFDITNGKGDVKRLSAIISQVTEISNAIGSEYRYKVALKIQWQNRIQMLEVNLKDRSRLTYKMLIGRDWLANNAIVDSSL
ncbi:MAG: hypothetical protein GY787_13595 [Alteromonadales bacterium]|nr:hypothetical protein [Alteromonadales bacterium]